jgi:hypothetical protein
MAVMEYQGILFCRTSSPDSPNLQAQTRLEAEEGLSVTACSASSFIGETRGNLSNEGASCLGVDSHSHQVDKSVDALGDSNHKTDSEYRPTSPSRSGHRGDRKLQSQIAKIYWRGSLVKRIWDSFDKYKLELENGETAILTIKEHNDWFNEIIEGKHRRDPSLVSV